MADPNEGYKLNYQKVLLIFFTWWSYIDNWIIAVRDRFQDKHDNIKVTDAPPEANYVLADQTHTNGTQQQSWWADGYTQRKLNSEWLEWKMMIQQQDSYRHFLLCKQLVRYYFCRLQFGRWWWTTKRIMSIDRQHIAAVIHLKMRGEKDGVIKKQSKCSDVMQ